MKRSSMRPPNAARRRRADPKACLAVGLVQGARAYRADQPKRRRASPPAGPAPLRTTSSKRSKAFPDRLPDKCLDNIVIVVAVDVFQPP